MALRNILLLISLITVISPARSIDRTADYLKNEPKGNSLNDKEWSKLKDDYKYKIPKPDTTKPKDKQNRNSFSFGEFQGFQILTFASIFVLIGFIIYFLIRNGFLGDSVLRKNKILANTHEEPDDINELDIEPLLREALKNKDFRLATRLRFLSLLQLLNQKKLIHWERFSTNKDYIEQLRGSKFEASFRQICATYEMVWYGNYSMDESQYIRVSKIFETLRSTLIPEVYA